MIGLGSVFPVYAGVHKRAPRMVRDLGFEWLYRWKQEPRRLWDRYIKIPLFIWLCFKQLLTSPVFISLCFKQLLTFHIRERYLGWKSVD